MKRLFALLTALCLAALTLAACAKPEAPPESSSEESVSVQASPSEAPSESSEAPEPASEAPQEESVPKPPAESASPASSAAQVQLSAQSASLGTALMLTVENAGDRPVSASTDLGRKLKFYPQGERQVTLLPISYYTKPGQYTVDVAVGDEKFSYRLEVSDRDFVVQNLTVDEDTTNDTINNDNAIREWNEKIEPLKYITDSKQYWEGEFVIPVEGRITTEFGTIRYTNGSEKADRHGSLDIASPTGTPVPAANHGRVIFAQFIQMSGNVVVIEHGLGLKTWYFHMDEIDVEEGAMVQKGDIIGKVGATGFVTGPHLHYGMSVNEVYIDPYTAVTE